MIKVSGRLSLGVALVLVGCTASEPAKQEPTSEPSVSIDASLPILARKWGGFVGIDERYVIWPDGFVEIDRISRNQILRGQLPSDEVASFRSRIEAMAQALAAEKAKAAEAGRSAASSIMDGFEYEVSVGQVVVKGDETSPEMRRFVEDLEQEVVVHIRQPSVVPLNSSSGN